MQPSHRSRTHLIEAAGTPSSSANRQSVFRSSQANNEKTAAMQSAENNVKVEPEEDDDDMKQGMHQYRSKSVTVIPTGSKHVSSGRADSVGAGLAVAGGEANLMPSTYILDPNAPSSYAHSSTNRLILN